MDARSTAQDVHRCDLCETAIAQSYCDFCDVNLCRPCIGEHILDEYDTHKIVRFQDRRSTLIYPKCITHTSKNCELQCKDCDNNFICSSCTASEQHRGHIFVEVFEVYKTKKEVIAKDTEKLKNFITPKYEEIAVDLENQIANIDGGYQNITTEIFKLGQIWHREVDIVINKMETEIIEMKVKHRDILQKHLDEIKQIQLLINKTQLSIEEIKESTEVLPTIEYRSQIREFSKMPPKIKVTLPTIVPKPADTEKLYNLFGQITPLSTSTEENVLSLTSVRQILDKPELIATIHTGYKENLYSVTCEIEDRIWTSGESRDIKCFSIKGSLLQKIQTKSGHWPNDIAVNSDGDLLYSEWFTETVNKLKTGKTEELIRLQGWTPVNLCSTSFGDLLVTMFSDDETQSKVICYSGSTEKQTIQFDNEGKPLYSGNRNIKYITENRNHDICVADSEVGAVVVVNQTGKLRWRYTGHPSVTKTKPFNPHGITTDSQSLILTGDFDNHRIHCLDQNGQLIRCIDNCDLENPSGLYVDKSDNLFVCECFKGNIKKLKYWK